MNIENINLLIDAIQTGDGHPEIGFNMTCWIGPTGHYSPDQSNRSCGTAACIGGWCAILSGVELGDMYVRSTKIDFTLITETFLEVPRSIAYDLTCPSTPLTWGGIPVDLTVAVLENLKITGKVDWRITAQNPVDTA